MRTVIEVGKQYWAFKRNEDGIWWEDKPYLVNVIKLNDPEPGLVLVELNLDKTKKVIHLSAINEYSV